MARPGTEEHVVRTVYLLLCASAMFAWLALPAEGTKTYQYSERVQHACANDYRAHCGEYGIETSALRLCVNKAGQQLSHGCVNALVADGQVSRAEVEAQAHGPLIGGETDPALRRYHFIGALPGRSEDMRPTSPPRRRCALIVEDEILIALDLEDAMSDLGF